MQTDPTQISIITALLHYNYTTLMYNTTCINMIHPFLVLLIIAFLIITLYTPQIKTRNVIKYVGT